MIALSAVSSLASSIFPKFISPTLTEEEWNKHNNDLKQKLFPLHQQLSNTTSKEDIETLGALIGQAIGHFVSERSEVFENSEIKSNAKYVSHQSKAMQQLKSHKKQLQRQLMTNFYSDFKKHEKKKHDIKTTTYQEDLQKKNRWQFSKAVTRGEFGKEKKSTNIFQSCSKPTLLSILNSDHHRF